MFHYKDVLTQVWPLCLISPSNQTLQCPILTIRCYPWSAGSWQVFHIVGLCVFSNQIHWSDESRFLLHVTDGRMRVWRHKNTAYIPRNIQPTVPYGGGSVMVWGCISHNCKLNLVTLLLLEQWGLVLLSIYTGLVASGWLSKWGTTTGCKTSLMYWSPVRLPCMVTKFSLNVHCWQTDIDEHVFAWCLAWRGWNLRTWCKIHWSDESRFLLHVTDGRMRAWRHKNTAYRYNAMSSPPDVTRRLPDLGKPFTLLVCVCFLTSRLTTE
jgi:hypothetical protein